VVRKKVQSMLTDPQRARRDDPGDPDVCNLYPFHKLYSPPEMQKEIDADCRSASIGCGDCKLKLADTLLEGIRPIMEQRRQWASRPGDVREILDAGTRRAQTVARKTLEEAKASMRFDRKNA